MYKTEQNQIERAKRRKNKHKKKRMVNEKW